MGVFRVGDVDRRLISSPLLVVTELIECPVEGAVQVVVDALGILLLQEAKQSGLLHLLDPLAKLVDVVYGPCLNLVNLQELISIALNKVVLLTIVGLDLSVKPVRWPAIGCPHTPASSSKY